MTKKTETFTPPLSFLGRLAILLAPQDMTVLSAGRSAMAAPQPDQKRHRTPAHRLCPAACP